MKDPDLLRGGHGKIRVPIIMRSNERNVND